MFWPGARALSCNNYDECNKWQKHVPYSCVSNAYCLLCLRTLLVPFSYVYS